MILSDTVKYKLREELNKSLITERISDVVFHYTHEKNAISILNDNAIRLSVASNREDIGSKTANNPFYLSTSRTTSDGYGVGMNARFSLYGEKLSQRYKGGAYSYFDELDEYEDRIYSKKPYIENFNRYIKSVDIFNPNKRADKNQALLYKIAIEKNIPVNFFYKITDYKFNRNANTVTEFNLSIINWNLNPKEESEEIDVGDYTKRPTCPIDPTSNKLIKILLNLNVNEGDITKIFLTSNSNKDRYEKYFTNREETYEEWVNNWMDQAISRDIQNLSYGLNRKTSNDVELKMIALINNRLRRINIPVSKAKEYIKNKYDANEKTVP